MPPIRVGSAIKPMKYERTHEENQERAYIAASRRSDRGLEARMESARRASAIHEKRTGRALRITKADVINEEMYEEVNDLPTEYRRLNAHLQTQSAEFDRRLLAYLSSQMATRQAFSDCWQSEQSHVDMHGISPSTLQQPQLHMSLPHLATGTANYRQVPYPAVPQSMHQGQHARSVPIATSYAAGNNQQQLQSPYVRPHISERQVSLPTNLATQPPWPSSSMSTGSWNPNTVHRTESAIDLTSSPQYLQQSTLGHMSDSKPHYQPWQTTNGDSSEPLSATLSLDNQQFFPDNNPQLPKFPNVDGIHHSASSPPHNFTNRRYSYNPNGRPKPASIAPSHFYGAVSLSAGTSSSSPSPLQLDTDYGSRPFTNPVIN